MRVVIWRLALVVVIVACGGSDPAPVVVAPATVIASHAVPRSIGKAITAPHSGQIMEIAISDEGDAAFTADDQGELRIWLSLDGNHEPVIVPINGVPRELALGHGEDGFIATTLDDADVARVLDFDSGGALRGQVQLAAEPPVDQIIAVRRSILVFRADQSIVRYDARGRELGRVVAPEGTQFTSIAARHDGAAAVGSKELAWLELDRGLAWGRKIALPISISGPVALSPNRQQLAGLDTRTNKPVVIYLSPRP